MKPVKPAQDDDKVYTQKAVVVLGMGRSGTSVTAGLLKIIGVNMGDSLKAPSHRNPKGYFEDEDFIRLHYEIFESAKKGSSYWDPPSHEEILAQRDRYEIKIRELLSRKQSPGMIWGWKLPWTNLTIELFLPHLQNPHIVVVFRNPLANAHSFVKHNRILNQFQSLRLINFYNNRILSFLGEHPELPLMFVAYEDILRDPVKVMQELSDFLGLELSETMIRNTQEFVIPREKIQEAKRTQHSIKRRAAKFSQRIWQKVQDWFV